jgi:hypothetical protein
MPRAADPRTAHELGKVRFAALDLLLQYSPVHLTDGRIDALHYVCPGGSIHRQTIELFHVWGYVVYLDAQGGAAITKLGMLAYKRALRRKLAAKAARGRKRDKGYKRGIYRLPEYPTQAMLDAHNYQHPAPAEYLADPWGWERKAAIDAAWQRYRGQRQPDSGLYDILHDPAWLVYEAARDAIWDTYRRAVTPNSGMAIPDLQRALRVCLYGAEAQIVPAGQGSLF